MSTMTWETFERYRTKGLDARRAGQWDSARIYLLEAARSMLELSKRTPRAMSFIKLRGRLVSVAGWNCRDCDKAMAEKRPGGSRQSQIANRKS